MKITLVTREFFPLTGGLQVLAAQLGHELKKRHHEFEVITRFTQQRHPLENHLVSSEREQTIESARIQTHVVGHGQLSGWLLKSSYKLLFRERTATIPIRLFEFLYREKITEKIKASDVVHFLGQGLELLGFAGLKSATTLRKPFIVEPCVHPGQWGDQAVDLRLYHQADALIAHTNFEKDFLISRGIPSPKIHVIHGFEDRTDGNGSRFRKKHDVQGFMVLFLGRRSKDKGYPVAVEAFLNFLKHHPDATLVVIGPADMPQVHVPLPHASRIIEVGHVGEDDKHDALAACDVLCVPSEGESFGIVYMEAWRYKKPIIARKLPVLEEINGDDPGGILVDHTGDQAKTAENVAEALCRLAQNQSLRSKLGERGFQISSRFVWEQVIERYIEVYQTALSTT
ncbi:MAG: glycosyltransferase family 4 protein [Chloracidobacterium sp.]|uniref:Glycosyltransferase family 4 protein n=1 Tax=Chloracidobacterium validum TaxID=2821543 RepID=A0ABX8BAF7_9BACT|nr:glycosyltransferase family 4 protein [Chloracidobacterium validum]QUW03649.1 glycosyltransferase family 4 protein [Chloracidobacterium validum]